MMKKIVLFLTLFAVAELAFGADEAVEVLSTGQHLSGISNPAAKLFFKARIERAKGEPEQAIQTLATLIAHHAHDERWIAKSEYMSAELYLELGLLDAADVTARQIQQLYVGTDVAKQATALRAKIEKLKNEMESK